MTLLHAFILVIGICLGSFVNAFVWRLKNKRNWVSERSECSVCGHKLAPKDLIPVFSYIFLRGRCRYCKKPIKDSPVVEFSTASVLLISYIYWPFGFDTLGSIRFGIWFITLVLLIAMFVYDMRWMILPDKMTRALLLISSMQVVALIFFGSFSLTDIPVLGFSMLIGGGIFHLIYEYSKGRYIGGGDVKLGYAYGLFLLDPLLSWMVLTIASLLGSIVSIWLITIKRKSLTAKIPFGPLLIIGVFVSQLFGHRIWEYINTLMLY